MRALLVKPGLKPEVVDIEDSLEALQKAVGGYIETVELPGDVILICNEEGKLMGLPANRKIGYDVIVGDFLLVGSDDEGNFVGLTDQQKALYAIL